MCALLLLYSSSTVTKHKISGSDSGRLRPKIRLKIKKIKVVCLQFPISGDKNISILDMSCRTSDLTFFTCPANTRTCPLKTYVIKNTGE